jgi:hypothetical protein
MKKYLLLILILCSGLSYAQNDSVSGFNRCINLGLKPNPKMPWKNPGTTAIHTLILPGTGYLANDKILLGFGTLILEPALVGAGVFAYYYLELDPLAYTAFGLAGAIHLVQFVHSVVLTHRSNKINGYVLDYPIKPKGAELSLGMTGNGMGLNVQF